MFLPLQIRTNPSEIKGKSLRILLFTLLMLSFINLQAQQSTFSRENQTPYYQRYKLEAANKEIQPLQPSREFTSLSFTLSNSETFNNFFCIVAGDTIKVKPAAHQPEGIEGFISELMIFDGPQSSFSLLGDMEGKIVWVHLMYAPPMAKKHDSSRQRLLSLACEEPEAVPQSVWRAGLPDPQYQRGFNVVEHLIVHHSAGSNSARNYTEVVRNIYLYHTQANGWSDIGYNYLIAPDGTLFAGRDPGTGEQDNVRGAHFCGKNSQTMGVCLLGDFSVEEPSPAALQRLVHLLSWKSSMEELNPLAEYFHPANPALAVIAGHRDGCATQCPGEQVYEKLTEIRLAVAANLAKCAEEDQIAEVRVYFSPEYQEICLAGIPDEDMKSIKLFNIQGKEVVGTAWELESEDFCFKIVGLAAGVYFLQTEKDKKIIRKRFMVW